jgi:hypothetical protein
VVIVAPGTRKPPAIRQHPPTASPALANAAAPWRPSGVRDWQQPDAAQQLARTNRQADGSNMRPVADVCFWSASHEKSYPVETEDHASVPWRRPLQPASPPSSCQADRRSPRASPGTRSPSCTSGSRLATYLIPLTDRRLSRTDTRWWGAPLWLRVGEDAANRLITRSSGRPGEASADQCRGFAQRDSQRIPGRIGSDDATQEVSKAAEVESGTSSGLARD